MKETSYLLLYIYLHLSWSLNRVSRRIEAALELTVDNRAFMVKTENRKREVEES